jgi:hypothetical protein
MPTRPPAVQPPPHPLPALATFELAAYRRQLEHAIRSARAGQPPAPDLAGLHERLADVIAEQDDRAQIAARDA